MNDYATLVRARNRVLAADPSFEQRALYQLVQRAMDDFNTMHPITLGKIVKIAEWYVAQPMTGEG